MQELTEETVILWVKKNIKKTNKSWFYKIKQKSSQCLCFCLSDLRDQNKNTPAHDWLKLFLRRWWSVHESCPVHFIERSFTAFFICSFEIYGAWGSFHQVVLSSSKHFLAISISATIIYWAELIFSSISI